MDQEWDSCDMPTGNIFQKWNIYRCLQFRANDDVITGQKGTKRWIFLA